MAKPTSHPELIVERFLGGDERSNALYTLELRKGASSWAVVIRWEKQGMFRDSNGWLEPQYFKTAAEAKRFFAGDGWRRQISLTHDRSGIR